jgi:hypothetical protein
MKSLRSQMPPSVEYVEVDAQHSSEAVPACAPEKSSAHDIVEVDAMDCKGKWYQAFVVEGSTQHSASVQIHFMGWDAKWDETIPRVNFNSHIRPRSSCEIGPKGQEALENVRLAYPQRSAQTVGAIVVETCEETFSMNTLLTSSKNVWEAEPCVQLTVFSSNLRVRAGASLETPVVGLLTMGKKFWFSKIVGSWAKLSPLHYGDLSSTASCNPKDFKPHDPVNAGWCLMKTAQGEVLLADSTYVPATVPVSTPAASSSSAPSFYLQPQFGSTVGSSPPFGSMNLGSFPGFSAV